MENLFDRLCELLGDAKAGTLGDMEAGRPIHYGEEHEDADATIFAQGFVAGLDHTLDILRGTAEAQLRSVPE